MQELPEADVRGRKVHYFYAVNGERRVLCGTPNYAAAFRNEAATKGQKLVTISCERCAAAIERAPG